MADVGSHHFVKGAHREVLVPQPSDDPNDPLNWSVMWKITCITSASMVTFTQGFGPLALAPMFPAYIKEFGTDLAGAVQFTGVCILVLGFSNFIWSVSCAATRERRTDNHAGYQSAHRLAGAQYISSRNSSILDRLSGAQERIRTALSWALAC
jgi:hypothetical protein